MTAQASTVKKSPFWVNFCNRVKANKRSAIILTILHIISAPLILINGIVYDVTYEKYQKARELMLLEYGYVDYEKLPTYYDFNEMYLVIAVLATIIAVCTGVVIAMNVFSYLYKKTLVDNVYSLPLTTKQRFLSDFLAGAATYLVPFLTSSVVTFICCIVGSLIDPNWRDLGLSNEAVAAFGAQSIGQLIFQVSVYGFFLMLMLYVLTVLVITCCGNILESVLYTFIANGLIPATIAALGFGVFGYNLYGIDITYDVLPWIERTSPIGGAIGIIEGIESSMGNMGLVVINWLLPFIFFTAVYFGLAFFLYCRRKAEDVSRPFVYKLFYYIMITAFTFCLAALFVGENSMDVGIIPLVITGAIFYFIMDIIVNRGFRKFWMTVIRYAVTITTLIVAIFIVQATDGLGLVYYMPAESSVKSIAIDYNGALDQFSGGYNYYYYSYYNNDDETIVLEERENISAVMDMHKALVEEYRVSKDTYGYQRYRDGDYVEFTYTLYSGRKLTRYYTITPAQSELLRAIDLSDEYIEQTVEATRKEMLQEIVYAENSTYSTNLITITTATVIDDHVVLSSSNDNCFALVNEFCDAYKADLLDMTPEQFYGTDSQVLCLVNAGLSRVYLTEDYPRTLEFIRSHSNRRALNDEVRKGYTHAIAEIAPMGYLTQEYNGYNHYNFLVPVEPMLFDDSIHAKRIFEHLQPIEKLTASDLEEAEKIFFVRDIAGTEYFVPAEYYNDANFIFTTMLDYIPCEGSIELSDGNSIPYYNLEMAKEYIDFIYENYPETGIYAVDAYVYNSSVLIGGRRYGTDYYNTVLMIKIEELNNKYSVWDDEPYYYY